MTRSVRAIQDVVDWGLCTGCGACYYACEKGAVSLVNIQSIGIRPQFDSNACGSCVKCLSICPGYHVDGHMSDGLAPRDEQDPDHEPALEIWRGHASDPEIRFKASSGGVLSALALFALEQEKMTMVLHTAMDETKPFANRTATSRTRAELLERAGSRYAPASPCDGLKSIEESAGPCVFIGKPCDAAAVGMLRQVRPDLDRKLGLVLTFFCAGTPSTQGTLSLLDSLAVAPENVTALRYRGEGWPGHFKVLQGDGSSQKSLSYTESWGKLSDYRPLRCHLCPDGTGRTADVSCGDDWGVFRDNGDLGESIVIVRSQRGREILHRARAAKYVELERIGRADIRAAQSNLVARRRELFGRLFAMRLLLIPTPRFPGFHLFKIWMHLPFLKRIRTIVGSLRRLILRGLWHRRLVVHRVQQSRIRETSPTTPEVRV